MYDCVSGGEIGWISAGYGIECTTGGTELKMGVAMADSIGDQLYNVIHSMGMDSPMGQITVCYSVPSFIPSHLDSIPK